MYVCEELLCFFLCSVSLSMLCSALCTDCSSMQAKQRVKWLMSLPTVEYFQRGELWTSNVSPVLLAVATLQAMLRSSPMAHWQCYSQAVQLLEYIHSECPQAGVKEEYIDLLVDFKTKVSQFSHTAFLK